MFGAANKGFGQTSSLFGNAPTQLSPATSATNIQAVAVKDIEVPAPPDDTIQALAFSPATPNLQHNLLVSGSWDNRVRIWEVTQTAHVTPKAEQTLPKPVMDVAWSDDASKIFIACADNVVRMWDMNSQALTTIGTHDAPVRTIHFIKAPNYQCIMTGSWDKTIKFWNAQSPKPLATFAMPERVYAADVDYPLAVVCAANKSCIIYSLEQEPKEYMRKNDINLKYQYRCLSVFRDLKTKPGTPAGFAIGSIEGRVAINYLNAPNPKDNFTFKCHRVDGPGNVQDIYAVNDMAFHPEHGTLATVGSDGRYSFWDKDNRTKLKTSDALGQPVTKCCFSARGEIFAYALGYDWSKGHEGFDASKKPAIFLSPCYEDMKQRIKK